jgi:hypothetical protein
MTYTSVFGSDAVPPSGQAFVAITLTANTTYFWPELAVGTTLGDINEVTCVSSYELTLPAANLVSIGRDLLFRNIGAVAFTLKDNAGGTLSVVAPGEAKLLYLTNNSTAAGLWSIFTYGTGTSAADANTLAGSGLTVDGSALALQHVTRAASGDYTVVLGDRARTVYFSDTGLVTCNLPTVPSVGDGFFFLLVNSGTGAVRVDPNGVETIDGQSTKDLAPGESAFIISTSSAWLTVGYGRSTQFQFTKLVKNISTGSPFTLTSVEAQNKLLQFTGTATAAVTVNVPAVVAIYYVECSYSGAYTLTLKTAAGAGVDLSGGDRAIVYCDGVDVVAAQTSTVPVSNLTGGVAGSIVYQSGVNLTSFSAAGSTSQVLISGGASSPTWSNLGAVTTTYSSKTTPVDADEMPIADSAASFGGKKLTWANLKATAKTYFDGLYAPVGATYITQTANGTLTGEQALGALATGILKNTTTTGVLSIAAAGTDYTTPANITGTARTYTTSQRGTPTSDNDLSFDQNVTNNFNCTPTAGGTLTFTNHTAGQSGFVKLVNNANYAIAAAATTKIAAADLTMISATGTYILSYYSDGTNTYVLTSGSLA